LRTSRSIASAVVGALLLALATSAQADVDISLPPGPPMRWSWELPQRLPLPYTPAARPTKPGAEAEAGGGTTTRGRRGSRGAGTTARRPDGRGLQSAPRVGAPYSPFETAGVLTRDILAEVRLRARAPNERAPRYPPPVTDDVYWFGQAALLRTLLYPGLASGPEVLSYLTVLGDPAREAAASASAEPALRALCRRVLRRIPALPAEAPEAPTVPGASPEQRMLLAVTTRELSMGNAYTLAPWFSERIVLLGETLFPELAACARSPHPLLRRNAVALLGNLEEAPVEEILRERFRVDPDPVVRARALDHLTRRRDRGLVPDLIALAGGDDAAWRVTAIWALGRIGDPRAARPLAEAMVRRGAATMAAAATALGRLAPELDARQAKDLRVRLRKVAKRLAGPRPRWTAPSPYKKHGPNLRNRVVLEQVTIALARLGDRRARRFLVDLGVGKWEKGRGTGHAKATGPGQNASYEVLKHVCLPSQPAFCEGLAATGDEASAAHLRGILEWPTTPASLRVEVLNLDPIAGDVRYLERFVRTPTRGGPARATALGLLANHDVGKAVGVARLILKQYAVDWTMPAGDVSVIASLRLLQRHDPTPDVKARVLAVGRAAREHRAESPRITPEGFEPFLISPPLLHHAILALGATGDRRALAPLTKILEDPKRAGRAACALALGRVSGSETALVDALGDEDPWVRYCAFRGLRERTGEDRFIDWVHAAKKDRDAAQAAWRALVKRGEGGGRG